MAGPSALLNSKLSTHCVLIDHGDVAELAAAIQQRTLEQARTGRAPAEALKNLCVLVWTACERYSRGELLSARQYLDGFAVNQLLQLVSGHMRGTRDGGADVLDARRRLEMRNPALAEAVRTALNEPIPTAALALLDVVEGELKSRTPDLPWSDVSTVRTWIADLGSRKGRAN